MSHLILLLLLLLGVSRGSLRDDPCDPTRIHPKPAVLKPDQITIILNGYSPTRIPLLESIVASYTASPIVSSIIVLWANPSTPAQTLAQLAQNLSSLSSPTLSISLLPQTSSSLNTRFLPRRDIRTRAVLICDDDVEVDTPSLGFAFRTWASNPDRLIGLFARSHGLDLFNNNNNNKKKKKKKKGWIYTVHPDKYSIILTKFMILKTEYLYKYSCEGGTQMEEMRKMVDHFGNCEDILMNFVVADWVNGGPVLVGAHRVRDWGDSRNDGGFGLVKEVGLSSRGLGEHRKRRGECIGEFHRVLGRMPLRFSYGKVVDAVEEQGLCSKGGNLVFCDHF